MSMSDCERCWDTPCTCGWDYKDWSLTRLIEQRDMLNKLIEGKHKRSVKDKALDKVKKI